MLVIDAPKARTRLYVRRVPASRYDVTQDKSVELETRHGGYESNESKGEEQSENISLYTNSLKAEEESVDHVLEIKRIS